MGNNAGNLKDKVRVADARAAVFELLLLVQH